MTQKSLIAEQKRLLVSENILKNQAKRLAAGRGVNTAVVNMAVAGAVAAGAAAAAKLGSDAPLSYAERLSEANQALEGRELLTALADIMSAGHVAIQQLAANGGFMIAEASGGVPKKLVSEAVRVVLSV